MDNNFYYTFNGFIIHDLSEAPENAIIIANHRLVGGKGGFGSMLRAIGSQIEKTTNREMCRDLSGRRMRDVNNEKKFKEWLEKADERERVKIELYLEKRRKRKMLLEQGPSSTVPFEERTDNEKRQQIADELQDAIDEAFKRRSRMVDVDESKKAKNLNMGIDSDLDSSASSTCSSPVRAELSLHHSEDSAGEEPVLKRAKIDENKCSEVAEDIMNKVEVFVENKEEGSVNEEKKECEDIFEENKEEIKAVDEKKSIEYAEIDLDECGSVEHLLMYDMDWIKHDLARRGLKCGGTMMERAKRLFVCKGLSADSYPASIMAGSNNKKHK